MGVGAQNGVTPQRPSCSASIIFPASPTNQTGASRRPEATGNVITGNLNSSQQMFKSNERQHKHVSIIFMQKSQVEQCSVYILVFPSSSVIIFTILYKNRHMVSNSSEIILAHGNH